MQGQGINWFGFPGAALGEHGQTSRQSFLESSLDAPTVAMVAPQLAGFDLWVQSINENADDGDVEGFLEPGLLAARG